MCITYLVLSCKLATSFSTFSIFILSGEDYEVHAIFLDIRHQLQENIVHHFLQCSFL